MKIQSITSKQNPRFRRAMKLHTSRGRKAQQRIIIYGEREVQRAIDSGLPMEEVYVPASMIEREAPPFDSPWFQQLGDRDGTVIALPESLHTTLAFGSRNDPVVAICQRPSATLDNLTLPPNPVVVVLEAIEKPGNIGAVARTCDGAGIDAIIVANAVSDPFHPNSIRASMGTVFSLPIATSSSEEVLAFLREHRIRPMAMRIDGAVRYDQVDWREPSAVVIGNEAHGLSSTWSTPECRSISIPMQGIADSLNASVASAVVAYEAMRQRDFQTFGSRNRK